VHLLVTADDAEALPRTMQSLGRRYVRHVNATYRRTGTLWEGRYRAAPIEADSYFLTCCRYIELNPVRARMVAHPRDYAGSGAGARAESAAGSGGPWSSWAAHAQGAADALVADHALYRALGRSAEDRQAAYRALFRAALAEDFVAALRAATNGGWALGGERFARKIAKIAGRRAAPLPKGRPRKEQAAERQGKLL
ncbi:MAG TPA: transposase, partial [Magnetospirillaceae bacterium]